MACLIEVKWGGDACYTFGEAVGIEHYRAVGADSDFVDVEADTSLEAVAFAIQLLADQGRSPIHNDFVSVEQTSADCPEGTAWEVCIGSCETTHLKQATEAWLANRPEGPNAQEEGAHLAPIPDAAGPQAADTTNQEA